MKAFVRTSGRRAAVVLGALALATGAAACGGDAGSEERSEGGGAVETTDEAAEAPAEDEAGQGDDETGEDSGEPSDSEEADTDTDGDADDAEGDAAAEPLTEDELTSAAERFIEFMQTAVNGDSEAACAIVLNPVSKEPMTGSELTACADELDNRYGGAAGPGEGSMDMLNSSNVTAVDNGDGTASIEMMGQPVPQISLVQATDGQFYVDIGI